jgi:hypothetical protein
MASAMSGAGATARSPEREPDKARDLTRQHTILLESSLVFGERVGATARHAAHQFLDAPLPRHQFLLQLSDLGLVVGGAISGSEPDPRSQLAVGHIDDEEPKPGTLGESRSRTAASVASSAVGLS